MEAFDSISKFLRTNSAPLVLGGWRRDDDFETGIAPHDRRGRASVAVPAFLGIVSPPPSHAAWRRQH